MGALLVAAATVVAACSSGGASSSASREPDTTAVVVRHAHGPSTGCHASKPVPPGTSIQTFALGPDKREYELDVPQGYAGRTPFALLFGLHALSISYKFVGPIAGFDGMHGRYNFISVYPSGRLHGSAPYWNAAPAPDNYDVVYLGRLLDHLEAVLCIDTGRVFSAGMSNGAQMSSLLACRMPQRIAAIAAISGVEYDEPCQLPPVPVIAFHGVRDPFVPYKGGGLNSVTIAKQNFYLHGLPAGVPTPTGVDEAMRRWAAHNGCDSKYSERQISREVRKRSWQHCRAPTVLYIVVNGGHQWPGRPQPTFEKTFGHGTSDIDATNLLFALFFTGKV
jgi:polyhydroxybutyrate depolymerase